MRSEYNCDIRSPGIGGNGYHFNGSTPPTVVATEVVATATADDRSLLLGVSNIDDADDNVIELDDDAANAALIVATSISPISAM
jgi:hypothetical protein